MTKIALLTPTNLLIEKAKFMASESYEPRFEYAQPIEPDTLNYYGLPQPTFFNHALAMLKKFPRPTGQPDRATPEEIQAAVELACQAAGLPNLKLDFSPDHLSQVRIEKTILHVRTPIQFTVAQLNGKIHHEIETHYLRLLNHLTLGLDLPAEDYAFRSTEEGLANLHNSIDQPETPMRKTFLTYAGCFLAQQLGFREVFQELIKAGSSTEMAWSITTRNKRGLADTSQPGGFTKDRTYLEGAVAVWRWLLEPNHDIHDLYAGRISLGQVSKTKNLVQAKNPPPKLHFPSFIADPNKYLAIISQIGQTNQFNDLSL